MEEEQQLILNVKELFLNYKLYECIQYVNEQDSNKSFYCHQYLQLYKGLSFFEIGYIQDGQSCLEQLFEQIERNKGEQVEGIDLITRIQYQTQIYYYDQYKSEELNEEFYKICEKYRQQNENTVHYSKGIYLFGIGVFTFIDDHKNPKNKKCLQYLEEALQVIDDFKQELIYFLGWVYRNKCLNKQAIEISKQLQTINPLYPSLSNNLAIYYEEFNNHELVEYHYNQAEKLCPQNSVILINIGDYYKTIKNQEKALEYYEKAYNLTNRSGSSCLQLGKALCELNRREEGIKKFEEGLIIEPQNPYLYEILAQKIAKKQPIEARNLMQKCLELCPKNGFFYCSMGEIAQAQNNFISALEWYQKCLQFPIKKFIKYKAHTMIARCYIESQQFEKSLDHFFIATNYEFLKYDKNNIFYTCEIINEGDLVPLIYVVNLINSQKGNIVSKYSKFSSQIWDYHLKSLFNYHLDKFRSTLELLAQQLYIQQYLTFQSNLSHLDLYFD